VPWADELRFAAVDIDASNVRLEVCREFKRRGIKVEVNTRGKDDQSQVWDRMAAAGVQWLQTDFAEDVIACVANTLAINT